MSKPDCLPHDHANHLRELELIDRAFRYGTLISAGLLASCGVLILSLHW